MSIRYIFAATCLVAFAGGIFVAIRTLKKSDPPGDWMPTATLDQRVAAYEKEQTWGACAFTPIADTDAFRVALMNMPLRVLGTIDPEHVDTLREVLYEQLNARRTGSLERYRDTCMKNRRPLIDSRNRDWVARKYALRFEEDLPNDASPDDVFARFWREEYDTLQGGRRFRELCLEEGGALMIVGDVRSADLVTFMLPEEQKRWFTWSGARRLHSTEMFLSPRSLDELLQTNQVCKLAEVILIIRSENEDVWCWLSQWYLEPDTLEWHVRGSWAVCSRRRYDIPI